jgi:CRISPR/Cas system CMR subunit Cmr4 (Cas7 group RAMP superfamily)
MRDPAGRLRDSNGVRPLSARWVVCADLVLETPALLGGADTGVADACLVRDRLSGLPLLTGASLGGAMRSHLADRLFGYGVPESTYEVASLFGATLGRGDQANGADAQSPLIVFDSLGELPEGVAEIRDGVALDPASGTAEDHKKFDAELIPAGTRFPLRLELIVGRSSEEQSLLERLTAALEGLAPWEVTVGGRGSRGLGRVRATGWRARRSDLATPQGWVAWLTSEGGGLGLPCILAEHEPSSSPEQALAAAWPMSLRRLPDHRRRVVATASLALRRGLLVRSPGRSADDPDAIHLQSGTLSAVPGTGLAGSLRARAGRIARLVRPTPEAAQVLVEDLFGPRTGDLRASRLRVGESVIGGEGMRVRGTRIKIDRATQAVVKGALLEEEVQIGGRAEVRLEIREPRPGETGLLLLLLKDLISGDLPVGGTAAVGRGTFEGAARVTLAGQETEIEFRPGQAADPAMEDEIGQLWQLR